MKGSSIRRPSGAASQPPGVLRLGDVAVKTFLRRYWQRRPLLVRDALSGLISGLLDQAPPFTARELFALARDPDVESRLVHAPGSGRSWRLRQGPFTRLPPRRQPGWSLLVQGVDLHLPAGRALMDRFRFVPDARLDDLMVSFATDGGGVGPHVDSYDVFLLQIHGARRWRIAPPGQSALVAGAPLKILAEFTAQQDWLLETGDMLYVPPGWAHEGTAVGECMTCSIGFRAPAPAELRQAFFGFLADRQPASPTACEPARQAQRRYRDRTTEAARNPAEIPTDMAVTLLGWLQEYRPPAQLIEEFIGCHLTEPKPAVWFESSPDARLPEDGGIALDRRTRMLYRNGTFFINGEAVQPPQPGRATRDLLEALADRRSLDAVQTARALRQPWLADRLAQWLACGWIVTAGGRT
jgi:50S ribosomal protein L16 3-hydroxylase